ncbi:MAG: protease modulator HflC [Candidatus Marinimicrobia bacterium]|jgi:membrane protease subunit HflC|nr:protease modulator HflC [Candidatus Neomarinimicrobiota bacterium]MDP6937073.1 protease modulator HflC [Candidatus Neomarinimicrobiota bacterium]
MKKTIFPILLVVLAIIGFGSIFILDETEQAVVIQFGRPVGGAIQDAGLHFKIPIIQTVIKFDKRILEWEGAANEIPTLDNKYIFIDAFARWRISDALQFYKTSKNEMLAQSRLDDILDGAVRDEIANRSMVEIIRSSDREMAAQDAESSTVNIDVEENGEAPLIGARLEIIQNILESVSNRLIELNMGIEIMDVQLKRINYTTQVQEKVFNRMISGQNRIAEKYRAQGQGKKQEILGMQVQRKKEIISNAYLEAQQIRGEADAKATKVYAEAYGKSPEFYNFIQTLKTYSTTLDSTTQFILSTDNPYLKYLENK